MFCRHQLGEIHFMSSPASAEWTETSGGKQHTGTVYTNQEYVNKLYERYLFNLIYLIFTHDLTLKCLSGLQCILGMLIYAQDISTIKAAVQDQYTLVLLNRDNIKNNIPINTGEHLLTTRKH